jgi:hypothetical protein
MTPLETTIRRKFPEWVEYAYWMERLSNYKECEWVTPTNISSEDFTIFRCLADEFLVARKVTPIWNNGSFQGTKVEFMYKLDLNYTA